MPVTAVRQRALAPLLLGALLVSAAGCAKSVVRPVAESRARVPRPTVVLVYDPAFRDQDVTENASTVSLVVRPGDAQADRGQIGRDVAAAFAMELVADIRKLGLHAERAQPGTPVPPNALLVRGQFIDVDEGNRVKRLVVGFGAGASRLDARVQVSERGTALLAFQTHSDSGKMPGGGVTLGAGVVATGGVSAVGVAGDVAAGGVKAHLSAIERLATKNAEQAAAFLSEDFAHRGWIPADRATTAKR